MGVQDWEHMYTHGRFMLMYLHGFIHTLVKGDTHIFISITYNSKEFWDELNAH